MQPMDTQDEIDNARSLAAVVASCRKYSYRVSIQTHKMLGVA